MGILQRAFPNSTLTLDCVICATDAVDVHHLLSCTELRGVTVYPTPAEDGQARHFWQAIASLGRLHGGRLQLLAGPGAFRALEAEPSLAAHVSQAQLTWGANAGRVRGLSSLTKLTLFHRDSRLGEAGKLDTLRQLPALQSLRCQGNVMQTLLVNSVPRSWSLLTELQLSKFASATDKYLLEQQCPQLQALAMERDMPLCLTALTSLTCRFWLPLETDSFQCSRLGHLHVVCGAKLSMLPSTLTSLSLKYNVAWPRLYGEPMRSQQSLVHICFSSLLENLSHIRGLVPVIHSVSATSVTSIKLTIHPQAFFPPDIDGQQFHHLGAWFPRLQRVHIHLLGEQAEEEVLISAAWLPPHCRLVVTQRLECPVRVVKSPSGCLSLPMSLRPAHE